MSCNAYKNHILVFPEDDANRQIANGFITYPNINTRTIQVLPEAGGWLKLLKKFNSDHVDEMRKFTNRRMLLLIDFDDQDQARMNQINSQIPSDINARVFVLGVKSEPEKLKSALQKPFETIGHTLALECDNNQNILWNHCLLQHNQSELGRLSCDVKSFLF